MKNTRKWLLAATSLVAAAAIVGSGAISASAEPSGAPTYRTLAGTGSDTTQDLNNGLASVVTYGGSLVLGSYNATNPTTGAVNDSIKTKASGTTFDRPNGSSQGVAALKSAKDTTGNVKFRGVDLQVDDLQFARSSSAATFVSGGAYSYIPLALDAVSYAKASSSKVPANLTKAELTAIYSAANGATVTVGGTSLKVGLPSNASADIHPFVPQSGSGTRSFWQSSLGLSAFGSAVTDAYSGGSVQEHDGSVIAAVPNALVPFSVAQYIAQGNSSILSSQYGVSVADRRHSAVLGNVNGKAPVVSSKLNTGFDIVRPVFTVVKQSELSTNAALAAVFQGDTALAYTAKRPGSSTELVITDFGFGDLAGGVTIGSKIYEPGDTTSFRAN